MTRFLLSEAAGSLSHVNPIKEPTRVETEGQKTRMCVRGAYVPYLLSHKNDCLRHSLFARRNNLFVESIEGQLQKRSCLEVVLVACLIQREW